MNDVELQEPTSREELKLALILDAESGQPNYLSFQARAVKAFGPAAGILCRHLLFWDGKGRDEDGFIFRSESEIEEMEGLVRNQFRQARKKLREAGVLSEERRGVPARNFYRLDLERLFEALDPHFKNPVSSEAPGSLTRKADGCLTRKADGSLTSEAPGGLAIHKERHEASAEGTIRNPFFQNGEIEISPDIPKPQVSNPLTENAGLEEIRLVVEEARRRDPHIGEDALLKIVTATLLSHVPTAEKYLKAVLSEEAAA